MENKIIKIIFGITIILFIFFLIYLFFKKEYVMFSMVMGIFFGNMILNIYKEKFKKSKGINVTLSDEELKKFKDIDKDLKELGINLNVKYYIGHK